MVTDELISGATMLCKNHDQVSPYLFQRRLVIDLDTAEELFRELEKISLIINVRLQEYDEEAIVADVNKAKLRELSLN